MLLLGAVLLDGAALADSLFSTDWYDCIDREECFANTAEIKERYKRRGYRAKEAEGLALSLLLSEYLKAKKGSVGMGDLESVDVLLARLEDRSERDLIKAFKYLVINNGDEANDLLSSVREEDRGSITYKLIKVLSYQNSSVKFHEHSRKLLSEKFIPFLALRLANDFSEKGECSAALEYLNRLAKKYSSNEQVVSSWAKAKIDCGDYSQKVLSRLRRAYKRNRNSWGLLAQMVRLLSHEGNGEDVERLLSGVDVDTIHDVRASNFLNEWAKHNIKKGDTIRAEQLLKKALLLGPERPTAYRALGQFYLLHKKDLPKAIAYLTDYTRLAPGNSEAEKMKDVIDDLKISVDSAGVW
jgi:tetratricopeptide (TPR) repeat protein